MRVPLKGDRLHMSERTHVPRCPHWNDSLVWLDWSYFSHSRNWFGQLSRYEDRRQVSMPQAEQTNPECRLTAAQYCLQWGAPEKVIFSGRVQQNGEKMGAFPSRMEPGRLLTVTPFTPCSGYGPQGENHWALRIRVRIRYAVKTLGPPRTNLD